MRWLPGTESLTWVRATKERCPGGQVEATRSDPEPTAGHYARRVEIERPGDDPRVPLPPPGGLLGGDGLVRRLEAWVADARADDAAARRSRERWLRQAAEEEATLAGVLADLGERRTPVVVRTSSGRAHQGEVRVVGADFVALHTSTGDVVVATAALGVVRHAPGAAPVTGDRTVTTHLQLVDLLAQLAAERERVLLVTLDGHDAVAGEVRSVGRDVVVVRPDGEPRGATYVRVDAVAELTTRP
jgi:hypothetical protein